MKLLRILCALLILLVILPEGSYAAEEESRPICDTLSLRGVWVASVVNLDYPSVPTTDAEALRRECARILDDIKAEGFNAVFLQVRPSADALYESERFPWSAYLTGEAGLAPKDGFDPLAYWIDEAHARGLQLHAWINPYRVTVGGTLSSPKTLDSLPEDHPARLHPEWVVAYEGNLYFDPGLPEVRSFVIDGVAEIVEKYDVDGIHLDDYFYPGQDFNDAGTYAIYAPVDQTLDDWRRENVTKLIEGLDEAIHAINADVAFGVSPAGIWANSTTMDEGSQTSGGESYREQYADTYVWVKRELIDYIAPQIYWEIGHASADYAELVRWWNDVVDGTSVKLYIGHAAYRVGAEGQSAAWADFSELSRQVLYNFGFENVSGSIFFRYAQAAKYWDEFAGLFESLRAYTTTGYTAGVYTLAIARPAETITTSLSSYYIGGSSDSGLPLELDGVPIFERSADGFWGKLVMLSPGVNTFTLTQGERSTFCTIIRVASTESVTVSDTPELTTAYPAEDTYYPAGGTVTLSCVAPVNADVRAEFMGSVWRLHPRTRTRERAPGGQYVLTTYTCTVALPETMDMDPGQPVYTMRYGSLVHLATAEGSVCVVDFEDTDRMLSATITADVAYAYPGATVSGGPVSELYGGMSDTVTALSSSFARLACGVWVQTSNVALERRGITAATMAAEATFAVSEDGVNTLTLTGIGAASAEYDDETRVITLRVSAKNPDFQDPAEYLPEDTLFSNVTMEEGESGSRIFCLTLRPEVKLGGYYVTYNTGTAVLYVKPRFEAGDGPQPLTGATILLDAGHGGEETGALGLLGNVVPEKDVNLEVTLMLKSQLEALGATVELTRSGDELMKLEERVSRSREVRPDLFLSIHANSMNDNVDISQVSGFCLFYTYPVSADAAKTIFETATANLSRPNKGMQKASYYVCRGGWTPSILFEMGFIPNPSDFEWLISQNAREKLAATLAQGVLAYFQS
ncbi:MAG: family 10 glycosylhydrolase [Clostridiaceae bacterium]|nr:family 10 glycosylhydrolase [Clostridiaceae bacterium]